MPKIDFVKTTENCRYLKRSAPAASNTCLTPGTRVEYKQMIITATDLAQVEHLYRVSRVPAPSPP